MEKYVEYLGLLTKSALQNRDWALSTVRCCFLFCVIWKQKGFHGDPLGALVSQSSTVGKWWGSIWESPLLYTEARRGSYQAVSFFFNAQGLSPVQLLVTPWTVACQAPLSMEFPSFFFFLILPHCSKSKQSCGSIWICSFKLLFLSDSLKSLISSN